MNTLFIGALKPSFLNKKFLVYVLVGILASFFVAGNVFAATLTPAKVLQKVRQKEALVKTFQYSGLANVQIIAERSVRQPTYGTFNNTAPVYTTKKDEYSFALDFSGASDIKDLENVKNKIEFKVLTNLMLGAIAGEERVIDDIIYLKINDIPNFGFINPSLLENQWIRIDFAELTGGLDEEERKEFEEMRKKSQLSGEQQSIIRKIFAEADILEVTKVLPSEKINGTDTYHYAYTINTKNLLKAFQEAIQSAVPEDVGIEVDDFEEAEEHLDIFKSIGGEIWIGKRDYLTRKMTMEIVVEPTEEEEIDASVKVNFEVVFKNYNKKITIDAPTPSKSIEEFLEELEQKMEAMGQSYNEPTDVPPTSPLFQARVQAQNASAQASMSVMRSHTELGVDQTGKYVANLCNVSTKGGIAALIASAQETTGNKVSCGINANGALLRPSAWGAAIDLKNGEGTFCVDSTGFAGKVGVPASVEISTGTYGDVLCNNK